MALCAEERVGTLARGDQKFNALRGTRQHRASFFGECYLIVLHILLDPANVCFVLCNSY